MNSGHKLQNAINRNFIKCFNEALDFCEGICTACMTCYFVIYSFIILCMFLISTKGEKALIITGLADPFFSVGFDFAELLESKDPIIVSELVTGLIKLLHRLLVFEIPTIAAINGHCYAGGVMLALCCDYRIMLDNCGDFCLSEVALKLGFPIGFRELLRVKMTGNALRTAALCGKKFNTKEALDAKLIDEIVINRDELVPKSIQFGLEVAKWSHNRPNYSRIKYDLYYEIIDAMKIGEKTFKYIPSKM